MSSAEISALRPSHSQRHHTCDKPAVAVIAMAATLSPSGSGVTDRLPPPAPCCRSPLGCACSCGARRATTRRPLICRRLWMPATAMCRSRAALSLHQVQQPAYRFRGDGEGRAAGAAVALRSAREDRLIQMNNDLLRSRRPQQVRHATSDGDRRGSQQDHRDCLGRLPSRFLAELGHRARCGRTGLVDKAHA